MEVKKFRAPTIKDATTEVKSVLGPEALIISTKKIKGGIGENLFEIAAVSTREDHSVSRSDIIGEVRSELMSIKEMIFLLNHSAGVIEKLMMAPDLLSLYAKLIRSGINEHLAKTFLDKAGALNQCALGDKDGVIERVIKEIMKVISVTDPFEANDTCQMVAALIGTTGVGKTTTIAKLAAHLMLKSKKKVGFISIDTYRIGAMDQLKTYANILGIPCFQAFKRKDILFALKRMEGRDIVLIDTAGQSQYDRARIEELRRMVAGDQTIHTHLLLSAATTESEMNKTAVNFGPLKYKSYIFTKIDETERCGSLLNQTMKLSLPISFITNGQNVPEDIEQADRRRIVNRILNQNKSVFHRS